MKSPLFLILVIILVLLLIHRSSSNIPVSKPSNTVPVGLSELNNLVKNVLSNSMPQLQQPQDQLQQPNVYSKLL
jgi:hypothetical protein